ncbi:hypothetical protein NDU88_006541 [Pleurodeles waltl]|uniref:Uncharacterized protein n=1 Tax=Pleurodeles waltl TaxID=8319 RepID=A0AAV7RSB0_PLEWA|nr:hypothetical protein NDU88_006541 [Pleurodeles waltl]
MRVRQNSSAFLPFSALSGQPLARRPRRLSSRGALAVCSDPMTCFGTPQGVCCAARSGSSIPRQLHAPGVFRSRCQRSGCICARAPLRHWLDLSSVRAYGDAVRRWPVRSMLQFTALSATLNLSQDVQESGILQDLFMGRERGSLLSILPRRHIGHAPHTRQK